MHNATPDRRLDLLERRMLMLGLNLYEIKTGEVFEVLKHRCLDCVSQEACAADLRRNPNNPVWESYCPNAAILVC